MTEGNPFAGLSIPSLSDIVEQAVGRMGIAIIDLGNPLQRQRLMKYLEQGLSMALQFELERSLSAATNRAITHVFRIMRDADYQEKKRKSREASRQKRAVVKEKRQAAEREARMDYSRRKLEISKATVQ